MQEKKTKYFGPPRIIYKVLIYVSLQWRRDKGEWRTSHRLTEAQHKTCNTKALGLKAGNVNWLRRNELFPCDFRFLWFSAHDRMEYCPIEVKTCDLTSRAGDQLSASLKRQTVQ